jgi:hypothetical protein
MGRFSRRVSKVTGQVFALLTFKEEKKGKDERKNFRDPYVSFNSIF